MITKRVQDGNRAHALSFPAADDLGEIHPATAMLRGVETARYNVST